MGDLIAKYGIFAGIGVVVVGAVTSKYGILPGAGTFALIVGGSALVRYIQRPPQGLPGLPPAIQPSDVEVIPLWFEVSLLQQIPDVRVWIQVVNYLSRDLRLSEVTATYLHPNPGPALENISFGELRIPPRQSWMVMCRRTLLDAETKALSAVPWKEQFDAQLAVRLRGTAGKKAIALDSTGFAIRGWIMGLPSRPAITRAPTS
jgi:hypothetical protein